MRAHEADHVNRIARFGSQDESVTLAAASPYASYAPTGAQSMAGGGEGGGGFGQKEHAWQSQMEQCTLLLSAEHQSLHEAGWSTRHGLALDASPEEEDLPLRAVVVNGRRARSRRRVGLNRAAIVYVTAGTRSTKL